MAHSDYTSITELPASLLTPDQVHRFAHRYGYAHSLSEGKRVLEVACGAGAGLDYLAQRAAQVVGLDRTSVVVAHARQDTQAPLVQGDAQRLPFAADYFELVLCFEALYYFEDYRLFLLECRRVLGRGGKVLIGQSNPDWPDFVSGPLTTHYPTVPELAADLNQAGFRDVKLYGTLPITSAGTRQRVINLLRRWAAASKLLPLLKPLATQLQRLGYGQLHALPRTVDAQWIDMWQGDLTLTPLPTTRPDPVHRAIYAEGTLWVLCTLIIHSV